MNNENKIGLVTSPLIACPHGFSDRHGGVSEGYFSSLNVAFGLGDSDENVTENRRRFALALGGDPARAVWMSQIHSDKVITVAKVPETIPECDGLVTTEKGLLLCVKTADCIPILFCDAENGVIGAVHAGWRGTVAGIAANCVREMLKNGAKLENIRTAIGPGIGKCCYETDLPFEEAVRSAVGDELCEKFVAGDHTDLKGLNKELLIRAGIPEKHISVCEICTFCRSDDYFSHRATKGKRGTMASGIMLPADGGK